MAATAAAAHHHLHNSPTHNHDSLTASHGHQHSFANASDLADPFGQYDQQPPSWDLPHAEAAQTDGQTSSSDVNTNTTSPSSRGSRTVPTMPRPSIKSRGLSDLGRPAERSPASRHVAAEKADFQTVAAASSTTRSQVLSGALIPLPWILASYAFQLRARSRIPEDDIAYGAADVVSASVVDACLYSLLISSVSHLGITAGHRAQQNRTSLKGKSPARRQQRLNRVLSIDTVAEVSSRILGLTLPLCGVMLLGIFPSALAIILSNGLPISGSTPLKRIARLVQTSSENLLKSICALSLLTFAVFQASSFSSATWGVSALAASIIAFPSPFLVTTSASKSRFDIASSPIATLQAAGRDRIFIPMASYVSAFLAGIFYFFSPSQSPFSGAAMLVLLLASLAAIANVFLTNPSLQATQHRYAPFSSITVLSVSSFLTLPSDSVFALLAFPSLAALAIIFDSRLSLTKQGHVHRHHHYPHPHKTLSVLSQWLLKSSSPGSILHSVLSEASSRRIAYFGVINLLFMLVQFFYGFATGSLGLLTDSIHMLFDCLGLVVGLAAAVMTKWPPSERFPYGYAKVSTLSGFANGIFLILVSVEIVLDAMHRLREGSELQRLNELLVVSILGLLVNIIGLTAFGDAHHHGHSHGDGHDHHHDDNMHGIYLHVLSDALGSVAVIVSTLLIKYNTWHGWDPLASCIIAVAIAASAYPLVKSSGSRLLLALSDEAEYKCRGVLQGLSELPQVKGYAGVRLWLQDSPNEDHHHHHRNGHSHKHDDHENEHSSHDHHSHNHHVHDNGHAHPPSSCSAEQSHTAQVSITGSIHILAVSYADIDRVRESTEAYLRSHGLDLLIHVEKEGTSCWCGVGSRVSPQ